MTRLSKPSKKTQTIRMENLRPASCIPGLLLLVVTFQLGAHYQNIASVFSNQYVYDVPASVVLTSATATGTTAGASILVATSSFSDDTSVTNPKINESTSTSTAPIRSKVKVATQTSFPKKAIGTTSTTESIMCPTEPPTDIVISRSAVLAQNNTRLAELKQFTFEKYERYLLDNAGKEHYALLHYLTREYANASSHCHVVDIGTRYVTSALALGSTGTPVWTFDLPQSGERFAAFRNQSQDQWNDQLENKHNVHIKFHNVNLLTVSNEEFSKYMSTWLILLDTAHMPYTIPFEREVIDRLLAMNFKGILVLDDIQWGTEMPRWWTELQEMASSLTKPGRFTVHDLTSIGHSSGTGLVDFSGKFQLVD